MSGLHWFVQTEIGLLLLCFLAYFGGMVSWNRIFRMGSTPPLFIQSLWSTPEAILVVAALYSLLGKCIWVQVPQSPRLVAVSLQSTQVYSLNYELVLVVGAFLFHHGMIVAEIATRYLSRAEASRPAE